MLLRWLRKFSVLSQIRNWSFVDDLANLSKKTLGAGSAKHSGFRSSSFRHGIHAPKLRNDLFPTEVLTALENSSCTNIAYSVRR